MKKWKASLSFVLALVLVMAVSVSAFADGTVSYDSNAREFIFEPGSDYSPTDLFDNFKNLMPGDTVTEQIEVRNKANSKVAATIYFRSHGAQLDTDEFLSQLTLTVKQNGTSTLFDAPADVTDGLTEWVCLGTIHPGGSVVLDLELNAPITLGSEFMYSIGYIDWEFMVEEVPELPDTGMNWQPALIAAALGTMILGAALVLRKKRENA